MVEEDGAIFRLVPEHRRACACRRLALARPHRAERRASIGIEIVNPGHEWGYRAFPALQMAAVCDLCLDILARHPIPPRNVVAHSATSRPTARRIRASCSTGRAWRATASACGPTRPAGAGGRATRLPLLGAIGYRTDLPLPVLLTAFQRHWLPGRADGIADAATRAASRQSRRCAAEAVRDAAEIARFVAGRPEMRAALPASRTMDRRGPGSAPASCATRCGMR